MAKTVLDYEVELLELHAKYTTALEDIQALTVLNKRLRIAYIEAVL